MLKRLYGVKLSAKLPALVEKIKSINNSYYETELMMFQDADLPSDDMKAATFPSKSLPPNTYLKTWEKFCSEHEVTKGQPPEEHQFQAFFERMVNKVISFLLVFPELESLWPH